MTFFFFLYFEQKKKRNFIFIQHKDERETFYQDDPVKNEDVGLGFNINRPSESHDIL